MKELAERRSVELHILNTTERRITAGGLSRNEVNELFDEIENLKRILAENTNEASIAEGLAVRAKKRTSERT